MSHSKTETTKRSYITTAASAFAGVLMAVPMVLAISSPGNNAGAVEAQSAVSTAQVADFAKFAYAYNQGFEAKAVSTVGTCTEATASADVAGASASATTSTAPAGQVQGAGTWNAWKPAGGLGGGAATAPKQVADMVKAYHSYYSSIYNSSTSVVMNTNSNNTVGSNNSTMTEIDVEDSKGVLIGVSNNPEATNISNSESFNKDSYNPETTVINDSFNKEETTIDESFNTETENTAVTEVEDSYNTETKTETETTIITETETEIEDSFNTEAEADVHLLAQE